MGAQQRLPLLDVERCTLQTQMRRRSGSCSFDASADGGCCRRRRRRCRRLAFWVLLPCFLSSYQSLKSFLMTLSFQNTESLRKKRPTEQTKGSPRSTKRQGVTLTTRQTLGGCVSGGRGRTSSCTLLFR